MERFIRIQSLASLLLAFFLFTSTITHFYGTNDSVKDLHKLIFAKKANADKTSDFQFPFEEKEFEDGTEDDRNNEKANDFKNQLFQFFFIHSTLLDLNVESRCISLVNSQRSNSKTTNLPLFISNRAILI